MDVRSTCAHSSEKVYGLHSGGLREGAKGVSPCAESLHGLFRSFPTFFERGPVGLWPDLLSPHAACVTVFPCTNTLYCSQNTSQSPWKYTVIQLLSQPLSVPRSACGLMRFNDQALLPSSVGLVRSALAGQSSALSPLASSRTMGPGEAANGEKVHPRPSPSVHTIRLRNSGIA